jgi:hypothetical protein
MELVLTPDDYDGVVSALTGNGVLCTTVCPTGYHAPPEAVDDLSHQTQHFVIAGRRRTGPQHPLVNFGTLSRSVRIGRSAPTVQTWQQTLELGPGVVVSEWTYAELRETTRSCVLLAENVFLADTVLFNSAERDVELKLAVRYAFGEPDVEISVDHVEDGRTIHFALEEHLGTVLFRSRIVAGAGELGFETEERGAIAHLSTRLAAGESIVLSTWLHFSDRIGYEFPVGADEIDSAVERHEKGWSEFWSRSEVVTGDDRVDTFRRTSLYTLRCQCTPWSIPATLSSEYWGGGAFHDEMYPFFGLLSSNYPELAQRIPYFRLASLPQARMRARGRGALYPWSSTEQGEERDPHGHWLTERFHLGQFAVCIHALFLYERDDFQLQDLYPVLHDLARYFALNMLERDTDGRLGTRACTDFDESVGQVKNGPFTICAAISTLEYAAAAADRLGQDPERAKQWLSLAGELRQAQSGSPTFTTDSGEEVYGIPDGKALHYSVLGPVFPFRVEVKGARSTATARYIHAVCRSSRGWKPGFSEVFEQQNWLWMAGHLGIVHALQENGPLAWEAIRVGPESAGAFLSPNEHRNRDDRVVVPWFTTGCGGWLYGLNAMFVQVDEEGTRLLAAVPAELADARFQDLRAERGVLVSAAFSHGRLETLTVRAPEEIGWRYQLPARYLEGRKLAGEVIAEYDGWVRVKIDRLPAKKEVSLLV